MLDFNNMKLLCSGNIAPRNNYLFSMNRSGFINQTSRLPRVEGPRRDASGLEGVRERRQYRAVIPAAAAAAACEREREAPHERRLARRRLRRATAREAPDERALAGLLLPPRQPPSLAPCFPADAAAGREAAAVAEAAWWRVSEASS